MKYHIVEFVDEQTVEVVPDKWLTSNKKCFWPPGPGNKSAFARKGRSPAKGWKRFNAAIKGTYTNYDDARRKLEVAQFTSDLESEDTERRKTSRPARYESGAPQTVPPPPPPPPPSFPAAGTSSATAGTSSATAGTSSATAGTSFATASIQRLTQESSEDGSSTAVSEQSSEIVFDASAEMTDTGADRDEEEGAERRRSLSPKKLKRKLLSPEEFQYQVLTRLTLLRMVQQQHGELLMSLTERMSRRHQPSKEPAMPRSPFRDYESLKRFDTTLTGPKKEALIEELSSQGGSTAAVCARRLLKLLLADSLAMEFSWFGKKGKHSFSQLRLAPCIVSAVKSSHGATDFEVEAAIREWLRHAPARHRLASVKTQAAV
ncbi:uncharacterized protein LOC144164277 isoform X2 [Haemaphysalis longicornis]